MVYQPHISQNRFFAAYQRIEDLAHYDRYLAAYIFGSFARGEATEHSDLDVHVIVNEENPCANINHPIIARVKLDLSFCSLKQLKERTSLEMEQCERLPMIAESLIVFDQTRALANLQMQASQVKPREIHLDKQQFLQFMFFHGQGITLYYRTSDTPTSVCSGSCAGAWPPVLSTTMPSISTTLPGIFSLMNDANGSQVAYNGHPLYAYSGDSASGQANGQGFGNVRFVAPTTLPASTTTPSGSTPTPGGYYHKP